MDSFFNIHNGYPYNIPKTKGCEGKSRDVVPGNRESD